MSFRARIGFRGFSLRSLAILVAGMALLYQADAQATDLYFSSTGGSNWANNVQDWSNATGGPYNQTWTSGGTAHFEGTAGTVTVSGGVTASSIRFDTGGYTVNGSTITLTGSGVIQAGLGNDTISSDIAGTVGLTKTGSGWLTLSGNHNYSVGTTLSGGVLQMTGGGNSSAWNFTFNGGLLYWPDNWTHYWNPPGGFNANWSTFNGGIWEAAGGDLGLPGMGGTGTFTKDGPGNMHLSSSNPLPSGGLIMKYGSIQFGGSNFTAAVGGGPVSFQGTGGTLWAYGNAGAHLDSPITIDSGTVAGFGGFGDRTFIVTGTCSGQGGITTVDDNEGPGYPDYGLRLAFTNTNNSYAGGTTVNRCALVMATVPGYQTTGKVTVSGGGALTVYVGGAGDVSNMGTALTLHANATLSSPPVYGLGAIGIDVSHAPAAGYATSQNISTDNGIAFAITGNGTATISGTISGTGGLSIGCTISTPTVYLSGSNTFTGPTTLVGDSWAAWGGPPCTLVLQHPMALQNSTVSLTPVSSALDLTDPNVPFTGGGNLSFGTLAEATLGGLAGETIGAIYVECGSSSADTDLILQGGVSGTGYMVLKVGANNTSTTFYGTITGPGRFVKVGGGTLTLDALDGIGAGADDNNSPGLIAAWSNGSGYANSSGNTFKGGLELQSGTVAVEDDRELGIGTGSITFSGNAALQSVTNPVAIGTSGRIITINTGVVATFDTQSPMSVVTALSGSGSLNKIGSDMLTLSAANTFTGTATVSAGILMISNSHALQYAVFNADSTGTLNFTGITTAIFGGLQGTAGSSFSLPTSVALSVGNNGADATFAGTLSGGSLTKVGSGTLVLANTQNNYSGGTILAGGELSISAGGCVNRGALTFNGGTLKITAATMTSLSGFATQDWSTFSGGFDIDDPHNTFTVNQPIGAGAADGGKLTKSGPGTLVLCGALSHYIGGTLVNAGTLQLGNGTINGNAGSTSITQANGGPIALGPDTTLVFDNPTPQTQVGVISGSGNLVKIGAGTLTLTGSNTYDHSTLISTGTLRLGNGGTTGSIAGDVTNNASLVFYRSNTATFAGVISGTGAVTQAGDGMLVLGGANTFTGATTVSNLNGGGITLGNALALQNSTLDYGSYGGTLSFGTLTEATLGGLQGTNFYNELVDTRLSLSDSVGAVALTVGNNSESTTFSGAIIGSGSLIKVGSGSLTLSGTNTYSGGTTVAGGTLDISTLDSLPSGTTLTMAGSAAVVFANDLGGAIELDLLSIDLSGASGSPMYTFEVFSKGNALGQSPASEVPEPGTLVLLAAAAAAALAWRGRRRD